MNLKRKTSLDKTKFEEIFHSNYRLLFALGFKMSGDKDMTKDAIQTLFLELWEKKQKLGEVKYWNAYLRKSFYRKMLAELKKKSLLTRHSIEENATLSTPSYEELLIKFQNNLSQEKELQSALNGLPRQEKKVLELRFFEGLSYEEIAENTGKSKRTVYNQIFSGISRLRKILIKIN